MRCSSCIILFSICSNFFVYSFSPLFLTDKAMSFIFFSAFFRAVSFLDDTDVFFLVVFLDVFLVSFSFAISYSFLAIAAFFDRFCIDLCIALSTLFSFFLLFLMFSLSLIFIPAIYSLLFVRDTYCLDTLLYSSTSLRYLEVIFLPLLLYSASLALSKAFVFLFSSYAFFRASCGVISAFFHAS